jgi:hypothetical protein
MRRLAKTAIFLVIVHLLSGPSWAQSKNPMPDPFIAVTDHYWVDPSRPAQTELTDCHLFEVLGWDQGIYDLRSVMRMSCQYLSRMGPGGSDTDQATKRALLAFEAEARVQMGLIDEALRSGAEEPPSGSLPIRTGWWADSYTHDRLIKAHALDLILGAELPDGEE